MFCYQIERENIAVIASTSAQHGKIVGTKEQQALQSIAVSSVDKYNPNAKNDPKYTEAVNGIKSAGDARNVVEKWGGKAALNDFNTAYRQYMQQQQAALQSAMQKSVQDDRSFYAEAEQAVLGDVSNNDSQISGIRTGQESDDKTA